MSRVGKTVVRGHGLQAEGRPWLVRSCGCSPFADQVLNVYDGYGHGLCACGVSGPHQSSNAERKAWHREHKQAVIAK